jgi:hypothetical protein
LDTIEVGDVGATSGYSTVNPVEAVGRRGVVALAVTEEMYPTPAVPGIPEIDQPGWSHPASIMELVYGCCWLESAPAVAEVIFI